MNYFLVVLTPTRYPNLDRNGSEVHGARDRKAWRTTVGGEKAIVPAGHWGGARLPLRKDMGTEIEFGGCGMGGVITCMGL